VGRSGACTGTTIFPHALCKECGDEMKREGKLPDWQVYFNENYIVKQRIKRHPKMMA
jgi:hypothetical protein